MQQLHPDDTVIPFDRKSLGRVVEVSFSSNKLIPEIVVECNSDKKTSIYSPWELKIVSPRPTVDIILGPFIIKHRSGKMLTLDDLRHALHNINGNIYSIEYDNNSIKLYLLIKFNGAKSDQQIKKFKEQKTIEISQKIAKKII